MSMAEPNARAALRRLIRSAEQAAAPKPPKPAVVPESEVVHRFRDERGENPGHFRTHRVTSGGTHAHPHAYAEMEEDHKNIDLDMLRTHREHRGKGHAQRIMKHVTKYADSVKKPITLWAQAQDRTKNADANQERLKKFYGRHGFVPDANNNAAKEFMTRQPKGKR